MKLKTLLRNFNTYYFFGKDMQDAEHCIWAYDLNKGVYLQFTHTGDGNYDLEIVEYLPKYEIEKRFLADARNFKPLA